MMSDRALLPKSQTVQNFHSFDLNGLKMELSYFAHQTMEFQKFKVISKILMKIELAEKFYHPHGAKIFSLLT